MSNPITRVLNRRAIVRLTYLGCALGVLWFLWHTFLPSLTAMTHSYPAYYTASRLVLDGKWSARIYDDAWFGARVMEMTGGHVSDRFSLHPPTTSLLLLPLAWLDLVTARVLWQALNLILVLGALWLMLDALGIEELLSRALFLTFALLFPPFVENLRVGQTYGMVLFFFALAFWSEVRGKAAVAGIGLGLALGLKLSGVPIWLVLAARRQWRPLVWGGLVTLGSALLGLGVLGPDGWIAFAQRVVRSFQPVAIAAHVAYQTTPSFLQRIFVASPDFNPTPLVNAPWLAPILNVAFAVIAMGVTLWFARRAAFEDAFAAGVTLSVILFPMALEYHYTLLLLPLAVLFSKLVVRQTAHEWLGFLLLLLLLCVPMDWNAPQWSEPANLFFAYPRLYGGWLVWLWLLKSMLKPRPAHVVLPSVATR